MKRSHFLLACLIPVVAVVIATIYLSEPSSTHPTTSPALAATAADNSRNIGQDQSVTFSKAPQQPTETGKPEDYSSNPPKQPYEKQIIKLVNDLDVSDADKVQKLLGMMRTLPPDGQVTALEHATRLIPDEDYVRLRPVIFGFMASTELRETVLYDVLTRGDAIRMPSLVELLRHPALPAKTEVAEILSAYLDEDHGIDPNKWDFAVKKWLVANPDI